MSADDVEKDSIGSNEPEGSELLANAGDRPVESLSDDRLARVPFCTALADDILAAPSRHGYVMGLTGPWGSGKTSILNMTVEAIGDRAVVLYFNPWLFSGTEGLVAAFFSEVSRQLNRKGPKLKAIAQKLAAYGSLLAPVAGIVGAQGLAQAAAGTAAKAFEAPSIHEQREDIRSALTTAELPLVVVLDDIDRLRPEEVKDIVRLVRLVGDFPNTLYLLAFDRRRVEECLGDGDDARGRAYLEKIVQVTHDVPAPREPDVATLVLEGLERIAAPPNLPSPNSQDWQNIFTFIIRPLLGTPRDVRRYLLSLPMTIRLVGDEVATADLLGIEAIRVLRPEMFAAIVELASVLAPPSLAFSSRGYQPGRNPAESPVATLVAIDGKLAAAVCKWIFLAADQYFENNHYNSEWLGTWRTHRRLASSPVLRFYLERSLPSGVVQAHVVDDVVAALTDRSALESILDSLATAPLADLLERLSAALEDSGHETESHVAAERAKAALPVFMDLAPRLPRRRATMLELGPNMLIARVALRIIRRIEDAGELESVVREALPEVTTLSGRFSLIHLLDQQHLVDGEMTKGLFDELRSELCAITPQAFAIETNPLDLASVLVEAPEGRDALLRLAEDTQTLLWLLANCVSESRSQPMGGVAVTITKGLDWNFLASLFGEEPLTRMIVSLMELVVAGEIELSDEQSEAVDLASKYASGWRPDRLTQQLIDASHSAPAPRSPDGPTKVTPLTPMSEDFEDVDA